MGLATGLAARMAGVAPSAIGSVLRLGDRSDVISLAGGLPADQGLPVADVMELAARVLRQGTPGLQYGDTNGLPGLRAWISRHLHAEYGISTEPDRVLVTHGSQQGIDLVCKVLLDPGDIVVVDRPSYLGATQVFRLFQARLREVPLAEDSELAELTRALIAGLRPRVLYVVPNYANPTGVSLQERQRHRLADLARRFNFVIIEDDPYHELWFAARRPAAPAIAALTNRCVHLGSFSKTLFPSARVGYLSAPAELITPLRLARQAADLGNSEFLQRLTYELVRDDGYLRGRLHHLRTLYRERRDALGAALARHLPGGTFQAPEGGFFIWARLGTGRVATDMLRAALDHGVSFVPGEPFYVDRPDHGMARLAFSGLSVELADTAAARLAQACESA
ncbi:MAG: PLP-dependent aminotransferase family protein [Pseudonocardiaceae bacterium]